MKAIIGLGNPGKKYEQTRHNVGFRVVDILATKTITKVSKKAFNAHVGEFFFLGEKVLLVKPQTYMNVSGKTLQGLQAFYKEQLSLENILIVYDDVALPLGTLRLRAEGGAGGHNGIKSIIGSCGSKTFPRLKVGVQCGELPPDLAGYVLSPFSKQEKESLTSVYEKAAEACVSWIEYGLQKTMTDYN